MFHQRGRIQVLAPRECFFTSVILKNVESLGWKRCQGKWSIIITLHYSKLKKGWCSLTFVIFLEFHSSLAYLAVVLRMQSIESKHLRSSHHRTALLSTRRRVGTGGLRFAERHLLLFLVNCQITFTFVSFRGAARHSKHHFDLWVRRISRDFNSLAESWWVLDTFDSFDQIFNYFDLVRVWHKFSYFYSIDFTDLILTSRNSQIFMIFDDTNIFFVTLIVLTFPNPKFSLFVSRLSSWAGMAGGARCRAPQKPPLSDPFPRVRPVFVPFAADTIRCAALQGNWFVIIRFAQIFAHNPIDCNLSCFFSLGWVMKNLLHTIYCDWNFLWHHRVREFDGINEIFSI